MRRYHRYRADERLIWFGLKRPAETTAAIEGGERAHPRRTLVTRRCTGCPRRPRPRAVLGHAASRGRFVRIVAVDPLLADDRVDEVLALKRRRADRRPRSRPDAARAGRRGRGGAVGHVHV